MDYEIDKVDIMIINSLMKDARCAFTDIAKDLSVSPGTIHVRMNRLEKLGIVSGSSIQIDHSKLGYDLTAFIGIYLIRGSIYNKVIDELKNIPEVLETHYTTGKYSIFAKVLCKNTNHMRKVLNEKIQKIDGIQTTETMISLEQGIDRQVTIGESVTGNQ